MMIILVILGLMILLGLMLYTNTKYNNGIIPDYMAYSLMGFVIVMVFYLGMIVMYH